MHLLSRLIECRIKRISMQLRSDFPTRNHRSEESFRTDYNHRICFSSFCPTALQTICFLKLIFFVTSIFESRKKDERILITSYVVKRFNFFLLIFNSSGFVHCTIEILVCLILSLGSDIHFLHYLVSVFLILKLRGRL